MLRGQISDPITPPDDTATDEPVWHYQRLLVVYAGTHRGALMRSVCESYSADWADAMAAEAAEDFGYAYVAWQNGPIIARYEP